MPRVSEQQSGLPPKVSVAMVTYNHERLIAQAIESVLMQDVDFPVELVIGEDCSTDRTRSIVEDYARRYPNVIRALLPERNLGSQENSRVVVEACRGAYLALLEGDDFWTDPYKLAKQVRFLVGYPECAMCFSDARVERLDADNRVVEEKPFYGSPPLERVGFAEFATGFFPPTAGCLLVNDRTALSPIYDGRLTCFAKTLVYCVLAGGKVAGFLPEVMAVYRVHPGGIFSAVSVEKQMLMSNGGLLPAWRYFSVPAQRQLFSARLADNYTVLAHDYLRRGQMVAFLKCYGCVLRYILLPPNAAGLRKFGADHIQYGGRAVKKIFRWLKK